MLESRLFYSISSQGLYTEIKIMCSDRVCDTISIPETEINVKFAKYYLLKLIFNHSVQVNTIEIKTNLYFTFYIDLSVYREIKELEFHFMIPFLSTSNIFVMLVAYTSQLFVKKMKCKVNKCILGTQKLFVKDLHNFFNLILSLHNKLQKYFSSVHLLEAQ